jgi:short-chain fatty acids transporter
MIGRLGKALSSWSARWVPDPFVLAIGLTVAVFLVGLWYTASTGGDADEGALWVVFTGWSEGFSNGRGLAFALQMALVLLTGHALAISPPVQRAMKQIAQIPRSAATANSLVALVGCVAALIHWSLGAIAGALLAREIARHAASRGLAIHYPLMGAAAYSGTVLFHGGISGSAPLLVAEGMNEEVIGTIPLSETLLSTVNLVVSPVLLLLVPLLFYWLTPRRNEDLVPPGASRLAPLPERTVRPVESPITWLQESAFVGRALGIAVLSMVATALFTGRMDFDLTSINLLFLFTGIVLHGGLRHYVDAISEGARGASAIVLQFPLYFGILGIMTASNMIDWISRGLVEISSQTMFPAVAFFSSGLVNFMVPSGGGQWAVQGDVLLRAGDALGVNPSTTIMAFAYGDAWSNMIQPFWALPLLGIMGLKAREIIGYTAVLFLVMGVAVPVLLITLG